MSDQQMTGLPDPNENVSDTIVQVTAFFTALTVFCVVCRFMSRKITVAGFGLDDYLCLCATVLLVGVQVCIGIMTANGIGRHYTWIMLHPTAPTTLGKATLAFSLIYGICQFFAKIAALSLLSRIFTLHDPLFRYGSYFLWVFSTLVLITAIIVTCLQCQPISTNWGVPHQCSPPAGASLSLNILLAVTDIFLILLPQPSIWKLKLNFEKRLSLSLVFTVGLVAVGIAIARMVLIAQFQSSQSALMDVTYDQKNGIIFTIVEPACVIICGCLPTIPKLFQPLRSWKGWYKLSSLVSGRSGADVSQFSGGAKDSSIVATKSWNVFHSGSSGKGYVSSRNGHTPSTERFELGQAQGDSRTYVVHSQV